VQILNIILSAQGSLIKNPDKRYYDDDKVRSYYNQQKGAYGTSSFGFSINQSSSYWNRIKTYPIPGGQKGDPSLKANGDTEPEPKAYTPKGTYDTGGGSSSNTSYSYDY